MVRTHLGLAFAGLLAASPLHAQAPATPVPSEPVVVTSGEGTVQAAPDRAWITVSAESRAVSPLEAQRRNVELMRPVREALRGARMPDDAIRTVGYDLQQEFDFVNGKRISQGIPGPECHRSPRRRRDARRRAARDRGQAGRDVGERPSLRPEGSGQAGARGGACRGRECAPQGRSRRRRRGTNARPPGTNRGSWRVRTSRRVPCIEPCSSTRPWRPMPPRPCRPGRSKSGRK